MAIDPLKSRFEEFRQDSIARTRPPGVGAIERRLARRYATRAVALVACALAVIIGVWLPTFTGGSGTGPATPPTSSATQSPSAPSSPSANPPPATSAADAGCDAIDPLSQPTVIGGGNVDTVTIAGSFLNVCPNAQIKVTRVTYTSTSPTAKSLTRYASSAKTLSATKRTGDFGVPGMTQYSCVTYLIVIVAGSGSIPASIPNTVAKIQATGRDDQARATFAARGLDLIADAYGGKVNC
jgi:hypothetical protein